MSDEKKEQPVRTEVRVESAKIDTSSGYYIYHNVVELKSPTESLTSLLDSAKKTLKEIEGKEATR